MLRPIHRLLQRVGKVFADYASALIAIVVLFGAQVGGAILALTIGWYAAPYLGGGFVLALVIAFFVFLFLSVYVWEHMQSKLLRAFEELTNRSPPSN